MKEPDFKEVLIRDYKNLMTERLTDSDIYDQTTDRIIDVLDTILGAGLDITALQEITTFYLLHSTDSKEIKERNADKVVTFTKVAQALSLYNIELGVLNNTVYDMRMMKR